MEVHGDSKELHGTLWNSRKSMESPGIPRNCRQPAAVNNKQMLSDSMQSHAYQSMWLPEKYCRILLKFLVISIFTYSYKNYMYCFDRVGTEELVPIQNGRDGYFVSLKI